MPPSSPKHVLYELRIVFLPDDNSDVPEGLGPGLVLTTVVVVVVVVSFVEVLGEGDELIR